MRPLNRPVQILTAALGILSTCKAAAQDQPRFQLGITGCPPIAYGEAGSPFTFTGTCHLTPLGSPPPDRGAEGWSISLAAKGVAITGFTVLGTAAARITDDPPGLRDNGFERTEITQGGVDGCAGLSGAVSSVLLSLDQSVALPPEGTHAIARFTAAGTFPGKGESLPVEISYTDGCQAGQPVENTVIIGTTEFSPFRGRCGFDLLGWPDCPQPDAQVQAIIQTENVGQTPELFAGQAPAASPSFPGEIVLAPPRGDVYAGIVSRLGGEGTPGIMGWSFSIGVEGTIRLAAATYAGTVAALATDDPPGLVDRGQTRAELIDPEAGYLGTSIPQGQGAVGFATLSFIEPLTLEPTGTATILHLILEGKDGDEGMISWKYGLRGRGGPVSNNIIIDGFTHDYACGQRAHIRFRIPDEPFHRGDVNDDGALDISDPVALLEFLFLDSANRPRCMDAADFNDDAAADISDAVASLEFSFLDGPPPPAPGPPTLPCGRDPTPHTAPGCIEYRSCGAAGGE